MVPRNQILLSFPKSLRCRSFVVLSKKASRRRGASHHTTIRPTITNKGHRHHQAKLRHPYQQPRRRTRLRRHKQLLQHSNTRGSSKPRRKTKHTSRLLHNKQHSSKKKPKGLTSHHQVLLQGQRPCRITQRPTLTSPRHRHPKPTRIPKANKPNLKMSLSHTNSPSTLQPRPR